MMEDFKQLELTDREAFLNFLQQFPPVISELTFTNLFMWRTRHRPLWRIWGDCLLVVLRSERGDPFGMPPVGPGDKGAALAFLFEQLQRVSRDAQVCRVDRGFLESSVEEDRYDIIEDRNNSDYVYLAHDLIKLPGNRFHRKKNHVNRFVKNYSFEYRRLEANLVSSLLDLQEAWCEVRNCEENPGLFYENVAIYQALSYFEELGFQGGAIVIDSKVEAFALGELLNPDTAVIHVEKANPDISGLYAAINQLFCARTWTHVRYVNREQDMGVEGLRKAKLSYHPHHLVDKFTLVPKK